MLNKTKFLTIQLQLFADGGSAGASGGAVGTGSDGANGVSASVPGSQGDDNATNNENNANDVVEDRNAKFESLIKGEYKDLYDSRVSEIVQKRLKSSKEASDNYAKLQPVLEMLAGKYGTNAGDVDALAKAIEDDDSYYEEEALNRGMSVEQVKSISKLEKENAALKSQIETRQKQERAEQDVAKWVEQTKEAQKKFPTLDLKTELKNEQFVSLLKSGIDVEAAFMALHHNEIIPQAMQYTAQQTEQKIVNKIAANGSRPAENGMGNKASAITKNDVSALTFAEREALRKRVAMGEKINL